LKEIPDNFISENCKIETLVIPVGVKIVGDGFASSKSIREVYVPYTVEEIGTLNDDEYAPDVYIYTNKLTDIESLCANIKTLYVPEELYVYYAELLKDVDDIPADQTGMSSDAKTLAAKIKLGWNLGNTLEVPFTSGGETGWGNEKTTEALMRRPPKRRASPGSGRSLRPT
jgi:hypothetical protein